MLKEYAVALVLSTAAPVAADKQESVQRRLDWLSKQAGLFSFFSSGKDFTKDASEHRSKNAGLKKKKKGMGKECCAPHRAFPPVPSRRATPLLKIY